MSQEESPINLTDDTGRLIRRQEELEKLPKEALIDILLESEGYWSDSTLKMRRPTVTRSFNRDLLWEVDDYVSLPANSGSNGNSAAHTIWKIMLISFDLRHPLVGVAVCGDVLIGRAKEGVRPDLDLSAYSATEYGVSGEHALLRPMDDVLWLIDVGSTNGTQHNGKLLIPEQPQALEDEDIVALGGLQFQVRIAAA